MCGAAWTRGSRGWAAHDDNPSKQHLLSTVLQTSALPLPGRGRPPALLLQFHNASCNIYFTLAFSHFLSFSFALKWLAKAKIRSASAVTNFSLEVHKIDCVFTVVLPTTCPPPAAVCSIFGIQHSATSLSADRSKTWVQASWVPGIHELNFARSKLSTGPAVLNLTFRW